MRMLPRLEAEEQLARVDATALGTGSFEKGVQEKMLRRLHSKATGMPPRRTRKANAATLAAMGIRVIAPAAVKERGDG